MKALFFRINVFCYVIIACFLAVALITSLSSGYPWSIICYNCEACRQTCPLGIDPKGFVMAALSNDPGQYINVSNVRVRLSEAVKVDPHMVVTVGSNKLTIAKRAQAEGVESGSEVTTCKMQAKDAARYCFVCGNCDKSCPVKLQIVSIIEDLRDDGTFNR
jgi:Fe-S oxidoreductase